MDRDHFIIQGYCLVCEWYRTIKNTYAILRGGFAPALTDEEVITMEICGECFTCATDQDIYAYFRAHYHAWFPTLNERTQFVRQAANLWQVKAEKIIKLLPQKPELNLLHRLLAQVTELGRIHPLPKDSHIG